MAIEIFVCDAIMGAGKTMAAMEYMRREEGPFIFVTKFLSEVDRVCGGCAEKEFVAPSRSADGKLGSLFGLVSQGKNIASTHALFYRYDRAVLDAIKEHGYTLILDEVVDVVRFLDIGADDVGLLINAGLVRVVENGKVEWNEERNDYAGRFDDVREDIDSGRVTYENGKLFAWTLPLDLFAAFKKSFILSYMFDYQIQSYYFRMWGVDTNRIGVERARGGQYRFCGADKKEAVRLPPIHVLENDAVNAVGDPYYALSASWFRRECGGADKSKIKALKNNIYNVFTNKFRSKANQNLWTTFESARSSLRGKGYSSCFLAYNARAVNDYSDRTHMAYCVNVFLHPDVFGFFKSRGISIDEEKWALSEMLQWVWRSAVRKGNEIWVYVPSSRMRGLFFDWIKEVSE